MRFVFLLFLLLSCGSGQQAANSGNPGTAGGEQQGVGSLSTVLMEVGRIAENAFYSFLELLSDTLGFTVKSTTKKEDVGGSFNSLGAKLGQASDELEQVSKKSEIEGAKNGSIAIAIRSAVDVAKTTLNTLKTYLESFNDIGDSTNKVVDVANNQNGIAADEGALKKAFKAFKGFVDTAEGAGINKPKESNVTLSQRSIGVDAKDGAKVLTTGAAGAAVGNAGGKEEVQGVGITAVNKLLVAVEDIFKKTV
ncbi:variable large family protein (plasmid) [Borrelia turicatae 91E135]|nr:variable large family protein [Borrelia turicatae 91E135]